jgi:hypothetical protein
MATESTTEQLGLIDKFLEMFNNTHFTSIEIGFDVLTGLALMFTFIGYLYSSSRDRKDVRSIEMDKLHQQLLSYLNKLEKFSMQSDIDLSELNILLCECHNYLHFEFDSSLTKWVSFNKATQSIYKTKDVMDYLTLTKLDISHAQKLLGGDNAEKLILTRLDKAILAGRELIDTMVDSRIKSKFESIIKVKDKYAPLYKTPVHTLRQHLDSRILQMVQIGDDSNSSGYNLWYDRITLGFLNMVVYLEVQFKRNYFLINMVFSAVIILIFYTTLISYYSSTSSWGASFQLTIVSVFGVVLLYILTIIIRTLRHWNKRLKKQSANTCEEAMYLKHSGSHHYITQNESRVPQYNETVSGIIVASNADNQTFVLSVFHHGKLLYQSELLHQNDSHVSASGRSRLPINNEEISYKEFLLPKDFYEDLNNKDMISYINIDRDSYTLSGYSKYPANLETALEVILINLEDRQFYKLIGFETLSSDEMLNVFYALAAEFNLLKSK